jgi:hypothetical protein
MEKNIEAAIIVSGEGTIPQITGPQIEDPPQTRTLIHELAALIARLVFFKDARVPLLIATWIVGTYVHRRFKYFGYLWIHSPVLRCGNALAWHSSGIMVNVTPATLFHLVDEGCTFLADEMERLQDADKKRFGEIMAIFNAGFAAGATVPRMDNGAVRRFSVYGPKSIAGINAVTDTIRDRSFPVKMLRKSPQEQTERLNMRTQGSLFEEYRLSLDLWAEKNGPLVQAIYDALDRQTALKGCDDRFVDIVEPLIAVLKFADEECNNRNRQRRITAEVMPLLRELGEQRIETDADESIAALCDLLDTMLQSAGAGRKFIPFGTAPT